MTTAGELATARLNWPRSHQAFGEFSRIFRNHLELPPAQQRRYLFQSFTKVARFVRQSARRMNRPEPQLSKTALDQLATYHWPGNVRELQNTVERAIILWQEDPLTFDLPASPVHPDMVPSAKATTNARLMTRDELKRLEREALINALKQTNGKVSGPSGAAQLLGVKPSTLAGASPRWISTVERSVDQRGRSPQQSTRFTNSPAPGPTNAEVR